MTDLSQDARVPDIDVLPERVRSPEMDERTAIIVRMAITALKAKGAIRSLGQRSQNITVLLVGRPGGPRRPSRVGSQGSGTGGHVGGSRVDPDRSRQGASGLRPHDDGATDRPALHGRWPGDRDRLRHPERHQQLPRGQPRPHRPHDGRHRCGAICHEPRRHPDGADRHGGADREKGGSSCTHCRPPDAQRDRSDAISL